VKFQTFRTELVISRDAPQAEYQKTNTGQVESQFDMVRRLELDAAAHRILRDHAESKGSYSFPRPSMRTAPSCLPRLPWRRTNLGPASSPITSLGLCGAHGQARSPVYWHGKPGGSREGGRCDPAQWRTSPALLHCVSGYPAPDEECNSEPFRRCERGLASSGWSDHTLGVHAAVAAVH